MRRRGYFLLLLLFVLPAALRAAPPQVKGAVVQTWHYDPQSHVVTVRILNASGKGITAYHFTILMNHPDGTNSNSNKLGSFPFEYALLPGATKDELFPVGKEVTNVSVSVDLVCYADQTVEGSDEATLRKLIAMRKEGAAAIRRVNEVIKQALTDSNPSQAALAELERLSKVYHAKMEARGEEEAAMNTAMYFQLAEVIGTLKRVPELAAEGHLSESAYLENYAKEREDLAVASELHSHLTRVAQ